MNKLVKQNFDETYTDKNGNISGHSSYENYITKTSLGTMISILMHLNKSLTKSSDFSSHFLATLSAL